MKKTVQLYVIPGQRVPAGPPDPPVTLEVEGAAVDDVRAAVASEVAARGLVLRSISSTATGIVAYAEERS